MRGNRRTGEVVIDDASACSHRLLPGFLQILNYCDCTEQDGNLLADAAEKVVAML